MKPGQHVLLMFEALGPVKTGEVHQGKPLENKHGNLWWAKRAGDDSGDRILICTDVLEATTVESRLHKAGIFSDLGSNAWAANLWPNLVLAPNERP